MWAPQSERRTARRYPVRRFVSKSSERFLGALALDWQRTCPSRMVPSARQDPHRAWRPGFPSSEVVSASPLHLPLLGQVTQGHSEAAARQHRTAQQQLNAPVLGWFQVPKGMRAST